MRTLACLLFLALLFSCESDSDDIIQSVIVGDPHDSYTIVKPNPVIVVSVNHPDSLDLNADGIFEILFEMTPILTSTAEPGSRTGIYTKNKLQILLSSDNKFPAALDLKTVLSIDSLYTTIDSDYSEILSQSYLLQSFACYTYMHCQGWGNFRGQYGKYIGFRLGTHLGWILVDNTTLELKIREYTLLN